MHAFTLTAVALLTSLAAAQIPGLPDCAASCVGDSFGSCNGLDVKCICSSTEFIGGLACCVSKACSTADQEKTIQFADSLCAGQGVNNLPTAATCAPDAASSTSAASGSSSSAVAASTGSVTSSASSSETSSASSAASESTGSSTSSASAQSQTGSSTSSGAVEQSTGGAESLKGGLAGAGLGMVLAGVVAAL